MIRYLRYGTLMGAVLLGAGCNESVAPGQSNIIPEPEYVNADTLPPLTTHVTGLAWDPEAFFMSLAYCGPTCPLPPFLSESNPLWLRSALNQASVTVFDPLSPAQSPVQPVESNPGGLWVLPKVPSREPVPFFPLATGASGSLSPMPLPLPPDQPQPPPIPPAQYLPTLTFRPLSTRSAICTGFDAIHMSKKGVLEAVAKHLSAQGSSTLVDDLVKPARFWAVNVFWFSHAGHPALKAPANGISVEASGDEASSTQVLHVDWAPPGMLPASVQSERGFYVSSEQKSSIGVAVAVIPNVGPPPTAGKINYLVKDTVTDAAARRPWFFPPLPAQPSPGVISFFGLQMQYTPKPGAAPGLPPEWACVP